MAEILGDAPIHTSFFDGERTHADVRRRHIVPSPLNRLGALRRNHRWAFPVLAPLFDRVRPGADLTILSTIGWAHFAKPTGTSVAYWYAPARWLHQRDVYVRPRSSGGGWRGAAVSAFEPWLRRRDRDAVARIDHHLAISTAVAERLQAIYGIEATIIHPPVELTRHAAIESIPVLGLPSDFVLAVSRFMSYKNLDRLIEAMALLPDRHLVIVGDGPEEEHLRAMAGSNVTFVGSISDAELVWCYERCDGHATVAYEDFGLTPLEAASFGKPTLALRAGGFLDTIEPGTTGVFVDSLDTIEIASGIEDLVTTAWDEAAICAHADEFSVDRFAHELDVEIGRITAERAPGTRANLGESDHARDLVR